MYHVTCCHLISLKAGGVGTTRVTAGNCVHYERHRPEETVLYQLVKEHVETFFAQVETETGSGLPDFVKDEFDAILECGIPVHGFLRLRLCRLHHERLVAFSCKRRGFCSSCGGRRMLRTDSHLVVCVAISHGPRLRMNADTQ